MEVSGHLLGEDAKLVNKVAFHCCSDGVVAVEVLPRRCSVILEVTDDKDTTVADAVHFVVLDDNIPGVPADNHAVAADLVKEAAADGHVFSAFNVHGPTSVNSLVAVVKCE